MPIIWGNWENCNSFVLYLLLWSWVFNSVHNLILFTVHHSACCSNMNLLLLLAVFSMQFRVHRTALWICSYVHSWLALVYSFCFAIQQFKVLAFVITDPCADIMVSIHRSRGFSPRTSAICISHVKLDKCIPYKIIAIRFYAYGKHRHAYWFIEVANSL